MDRLLYIVGPTATGKTNLALKIAHQIQGELISADSRQVYQYMTIGSGKDIPSQFSKQVHHLESLTYPVSVFQSQTTGIWGYDLISPNQEWSVAQFHQVASTIIKHLHNQSKVPIIVGGTGFYTQSIEHPPTSITIPPNPNLRRELLSQTAGQLQQTLKQISLDRFNKLNQSDQSNPRRLIRSIEVESFLKKHSISQKTHPNYNSLWVGLDLDNQSIDQKIVERVYSRIDQGFDQEVKNLVNQGFLSSHTQASTATGYRQWALYLRGEISREEAIEQWVIAEKQYARRQKTWFKKQPNIHWFDANQPNLFEIVVDLIKNWYANPI